MTWPTFIPEGGLLDNRRLHCQRLAHRPRRNGKLTTDLANRPALHEMFLADELGIDRVEHNPSPCRRSSPSSAQVSFPKVVDFLANTDPQSGQLLN